MCHSYYYNSMRPQCAPFHENTHHPIQVTENDILMGRGGRNNLHIGNEKLRNLAREKAQDYVTAEKKRKSNMSLELITQVQRMQPPGRFLKRDPDSQSWKIVPMELAREKVSQCMRDAVVHLRKNSARSLEFPCFSGTTPAEPERNGHRAIQMCSPSPTTKRTMTPTMGDDMPSFTNNKRRRTGTVDDDTVGSRRSIPARIFSELVPDGENNNSPPPTSDRQPSSSSKRLVSLDGVTVVPDHNSFQPLFDFELFDSQSLLADDCCAWGDGFMSNSDFTTTAKCQ